MDTATRQQYSKHVSVPSNEGVRVDKTITIFRPIEEVYRFWRRLENLPRFMQRLQSVTVKDDLHSHWVAKAIGGTCLEWDAEIIEQRENEMISWRSAPGADVGNAGSVWFTSLPGGRSTQVRLEMKYIPPTGTVGAVSAETGGRDPGRELQEDLQRLKRLLEIGRFSGAGSGSDLNRSGESGHNFIRQNPWGTMGMLVLAGFVLGLVLGHALSATEKD